MAVSRSCWFKKITKPKLLGYGKLYAKNAPSFPQPLLLDIMSKKKKQKNTLSARSY
jgi:hypothetical protein